MILRWCSAALAACFLVVGLYGTMKLARAETPQVVIDSGAGVQVEADKGPQRYGLGMIGVGLLGLAVCGGGFALSFRRGEARPSRD